MAAFLKQLRKSFENSTGTKQSWFTKRQRQRHVLRRLVNASTWDVPAAKKSKPIIVCVFATMTIRCCRSSALLLLTAVAVMLAFFSVTNAAVVAVTAASPTPLVSTSEHHHHRHLRSTNTIVHPPLTQPQQQVVVQLLQSHATTTNPETLTIPKEKRDLTNDKSAPSSRVVGGGEDVILMKQITHAKKQFPVLHGHHRRRMRSSKFNFEHKILRIPIKYWLVILLTILITLCCSCNWSAFFCYCCRFRHTADESDDSLSIPTTSDNAAPSKNNSESNTRVQVVLPRAPRTPFSSSSLARRSRLSPIDERRATPARAGCSNGAWVSPLASHRGPDEAEI